MDLCDLYKEKGLSHVPDGVTTVLSWKQSEKSEGK